MMCKIFIRHVYGKPVAYPACETAKRFLVLVRKKTFSEDDLFEIEMLGFKIEITQDPATCKI